MRRVSYTTKRLTYCINKTQAICLALGLLFYLGGNSLFAQTEIKDNPIAESLMDLPLDSSFVWMYKNVSTDKDNFHAIGLQSLRRAYLTQEDSIIAEAHFLLREWHELVFAFSKDSTLYHSIKTVDYSLKTGNQRKIAQHYLNLAEDYYNVVEYKKGQDALFRSLEIYEELEDAQGIAKAYKKLSAFAYHMEDYIRSIEYTDKALELYEKLNDYTAISSIYLMYVKNYKRLKQYKKARQAVADCIEIIETKVSDQLHVSKKDMLCGAYSLRGDLFIIEQDFESALKDYTKTWNLSIEQYGAEVSEGWRSEIGIACRHLGRYEEAITHLLASVRFREKTGARRIAFFYQETAKCYEQMGNFKKALEYQKMAMAANDKMHQQTVASLETETVVKYETGKKDQQLMVQKNELLQKSKIQNLTMGIVTLLAALLFALFYYFKKNKTINTRLILKNKENELLLKEIHHRVKNNLQTISSLLSLQSESISDKGAYDAVQESRNRVTSMALLHQKLYQGKNLAAIEMRDYFETIGKAIIDSFGEKAENISLEIDMLEIELDVDTAIPVGLITNELITNSIKHAFPNKQKGHVKITLAQEENGLLTLHITDNGQAKIDESIVKKEKGFGTMLIQLLTTQLEGKLEKSTLEGTSTIIQFPRQEKSAA